MVFNFLSTIRAELHIPLLSFELLNNIFCCDCKKLALAILFRFVFIQIL